MDSIRGKIELAGIFAVMLSLLLVAYEIRKSTDTAAAQAVFELNNSGRESLFLMATDPELAELVTVAVNDLDALTEIQRVRFDAWVFALLNLYESAWNHHYRGIINDEDMEGWKVDYCDNVAKESYRHVVQTINAHASLFRQEADQWCD